jgi:hypothetical protein
MAMAEGNELPKWPIALANLGKNAFAASEKKETPPFTIAICTPRINFAALFIGVGMISKYLEAAESQSEKERISELVGKKVIFELENGKKIAGRLEYCEIKKNFRICEYNITKKKKLKPGESVSRSQILREKDWETVRLADFEFSLERPVSPAQLKETCKRTFDFDSLGQIFGVPCNTVAGGTKCNFTVIGNKSRLLDEINENIRGDSSSSFRDLLRPQNLPEYASSFRCKIESRGNQISNDAGIIIAESSRTISELLYESRSMHRILLLGRNLADYEEASGLILEAYGRRKNTEINLFSELPEAFRYLAFHHS